MITSATIKTFPSPKLVFLTFVIYAPATPDPNNTADIMEMAAYVLGQCPHLMDVGLTGYTAFASSFGNLIPFPIGPPNATLGGVAGGVVLFDTEDPQDILDLLAPVLNHINTTWPGMFGAYLETQVYGSFWEWFAVNYDQSAAGADQLTGSWLFDRETLEQRLTGERLAGYISQAAVATAFLVGGKGVAEAVPRSGESAVLPAWRRAYVHSSELPGISWSYKSSHLWG